MNPIAVLHIPHSSILIPEARRSAFVLTDDELQQELLTMTDRYTDELFTANSPDVLPVRFPVSRIVLDPERYLDDALEPMSKRGMGVIYTKTSTEEVLRAEPTTEERAELVAEFYHPHHKALTAAVQGALDEWGACLLLDCHSFPLKTNLFGGSFFLLTGTHGAHVTVGVIWLLSLVFMAQRGRLTQANAETVEIVGLYWHFVDVVWIVLFTLIYLLV